MDGRYENERLCREMFGVISAMVTHDLKNTLAIINENAGLLSDIARMSGEDGVPASRVEGVVESIAQQVNRSTGIIKNLNTFSHFGDKHTGKAVIDEVMAVAVELTRRRAAMRKVTVELSAGGGFMVEMALMVLATLFCRLLLGFYDRAESGAAIKVAYEAADEGMSLHISCSYLVPTTGSAWPGREEQLLLDELGGRCQGTGDGVQLWLPACIAG